MSFFLTLYSFASSASKYIFHLTEVGNEFMYFKTRSVQQLIPAGYNCTPFSILTLCRFFTFLCLLFERKSFIQFNVLPLIPYWYNIPTKLLCGSSSFRRYIISVKSSSALESWVETISRKNHLQGFHRRKDVPSDELWWFFRRVCKLLMSGLRGDSCPPVISCLFWRWLLCELIYNLPLICSPYKICLVFLSVSRPRIVSVQMVA